MKLITAIIKPFKVDDVKDALKEAGVAGHDDHRGQGVRAPVRSHRGVPRCGVHDVDSCPRSSSRCSADDGDVDRIAEVIQAAAATGKIGDGKIWVVDVNRALRLRTGERDGDAI